MAGIGVEPIPADFQSAATTESAYQPEAEPGKAIFHKHSFLCVCNRAVRVPVPHGTAGTAGIEPAAT